MLDADIEQSIPVVADRRATKQIMVNLLSNAVKFTPEGGRIVGAQPLLDEQIVLMIADTGIGIAAAVAGAARPARSSRSRASSPRPTTARAWGLRSRAR